MQLIKVNALHVPVRLLGLTVNIGGVRQLLVEELDHRDACVGREVDVGLKSPPQLRREIVLGFHQPNFAFLIGHVAFALSDVRRRRVPKQTTRTRRQPGVLFIGYPVTSAA
jgi:hypothetical protein